MTIKSYKSCCNCYYGGFNEFCRKTDCSDCPLYNSDDIFHEDVLCKCNTVVDGEECPWYKENEDG